jgi:hypothetical protein
MLKQLPVKKEYLFIAAVIILLWLGYKLAFKQTLQAWQINRQLNAQLEQSANLSYQPGYLQRKNANLNKVINLYKADTATFRNNSISIISSIAEKENVKLSEVPPQDPFFNTDKFIVQKLSFEGDFFSLSQTLHDLQNVNGIGMIRSASYKLTGNGVNPNEVKKLVLEVYLEIAK